MARPRKNAKSTPRAAAPAPPKDLPGSTLLLPMEVQVGDRFTEGGFEWQVLTRPAVMHGAKTLRARVRRPGLPETEREVTWVAHERVAMRRGGGEPR